MIWVIGLLTTVLILDSLLLILLVLVQLPKKEAGMGQAFGGGATDALFGAGSGNALTKMTKYATAIFFILTLIIAILFQRHARNPTSSFEKNVLQAGKETPTPPANANSAATTGSNAAAKPNALLSSGTNSAAKAVTNVPVAPPKAEKDK